MYRRVEKRGKTLPPILDAALKCLLAASSGGTEETRRER
jgi:hypothetical protein